MPKTEVDKRFDPDVRFLLSNERTLLAWVRNSVALMAGGVVVASFGSNIPIERKRLGLVVIALSVLTVVIGYLRFKAADKSIRRAKLPSTGHGPAIQVFIVGLIAISLMVVITSNV